MDGEKMTKNIFENGGEFCMRGDPYHKPVEWHWFKNDETRFPIVYFEAESLRSVTLEGRYTKDGSDVYNDLIPVPSPPQIVPWESPDDVPDGIWVRTKSTGLIHAITGFAPDSVVVGGSWVKWESLHANFEYHTDRRAKNGWQPCGKVAK